MKNIKLICLDMDGTTLKYLNKMSKRNINAIINAQKKGLKVSIISGRPKSGLKKHAEILRLKEFNGSLSALNGGMVQNLESGKVLFSKKLNINDTLDFLDFLRKTKLYPIVYFDQSIYTQKNYLNIPVNRILKSINHTDVNAFTNLNKAITTYPSKISVIGSKKEIAKIKDQLIEKYSNKFQLIISESSIEVNPKDINKGRALDVLVDYYNIQLNEIIAFGDELNDIEMIKKAGVGVVVKNAKEELKKYADYVTDKNTNDGVGKFLEKYL